MWQKRVRGSRHRLSSQTTAVSVVSREDWQTWSTCRCKLATLQLAVCLCLCCSVVISCMVSTRNTSKALIVKVLVQQVVKFSCWERRWAEHFRCMLISFTLILQKSLVVQEMSSVPMKTPVQVTNYLPEQDQLVISVSPWIPLDQTVAIDGILPVQESNQFHDDDELVIGK